jgi:Eukaryotic translation initiation factor 3 subunit 7 (eIF-3)
MNVDPNTTCPLHAGMTRSSEEWTMVEAPRPFTLEVEDNPDGWGPTTVPERLKDVPFAPFNKGDKLGKASDWTQQAYQKYSGKSMAAIRRAAAWGAERPPDMRRAV